MSLPTPSRSLSWLTEGPERAEASLLRSSQTAAWAGLRVGLFEAASLELTGQQGEHAALGMILKGRTRARIQSRGQECDFSPGPDSVGLFAPQFEVGWTRWQCEPGAERMMIELDLTEMERHGDLDTMLPSHRALRQNLTLRDPHLATLMRLIADEVRHGSPHGALYATSLSLAVVAYLFNQHSDSTPTRTRERGMLTAVQKTRVLDLMQRRLADDLGLDELATVAGVSRFHFVRLFKNTLGTTPHRFLMDQRVTAARHLLETTALPLVQIAAATGFSSQSHLCTAMRHRLGLTPGKWRRAATAG